MKKLVGQATKEQIEAWKKEHGEVYALKALGHVIYCFKPGRQEISMASQRSRGSEDIFMFNQFILEATKLGGSDEMITNPKMFLEINPMVDKISLYTQGSLEKL